MKVKVTYDQDGTKRTEYDFGNGRCRIVYGESKHDSNNTYSRGVSMVSRAPDGSKLDKPRFVLTQIFPLPSHKTPLITLFAKPSFSPKCLNEFVVSLNRFKPSKVPTQILPSKSSVMEVTCEWLKLTLSEVPCSWLILEVLEDV